MGGIRSALTVALLVALAASWATFDPCAAADPAPGGKPPPDPAPLRKAVAAVLTAIQEGDRQGYLGLTVVAPGQDTSEIDADLRLNAATKTLRATLREKFGPTGTDGFPQPTDPATLEKALATYEVHPRRFGEGWVLHFTPQPRAPRVQGVAREFILVESAEGWRVAIQAPPPAPAWRTRLMVDRAERLASAVERVTASVRAGEVASAGAARESLEQAFRTAMRQWGEGVQAAIKRLDADFPRQFQEVATVQFDAYPVQELAFDGDGTYLAVGLINTPRSLHVIGTDDGKPKAVELSDERTERHVEALAFVGKRLAVAGAGFDAATVRAARDAGRDPDFSPEVVTDRKLRLVDPAKGAIVAELPGHNGYTTDAVAGADGTLFTVGIDNVVRAWKVEDAPALRWERNFGQVGAPYGVAVVGDRVAVASAIGTVPVFESNTGRPVGSVNVSAGVTSVAVGFTASEVALGAIRHVKLIDLSVLPAPDERLQHATYNELPERQLVEDWLGFSRVNDLAMAPAAGLLVSGDGAVRPDLLKEAEHGPGVRLWRAPEGTWVGRLPMERPVTAIAITNDGRYLAAGDLKGRVKLFKLPEKLKPAEPVVPAPAP